MSFLRLWREENITALKSIIHQDSFDDLDCNDKEIVADAHKVLSFGANKNPELAELLLDFCSKEKLWGIVSYCVKENYKDLLKAITVKHPRLGNFALSNCCVKNDQLDLIEFLINVCEADVSERQNLCLHMAASAGHADVMRFLITSPRLKSHADLSNSDMLELMRSALKHPEVLHFLVVEKNVEIPEKFKTHKEIQDLLKSKAEKNLLEELTANPTKKRASKL